MFSTLIASGAPRSTAERGTVPSVLLHLGVIAAMIVATQTTETFEAPGESRIVPLFAPTISPPQPTAPTRPQPAPTTPTPAPEVPAVPIEAPAVPSDVPTGIPVEAPAAPVSGGSVDPNALPSTDVGTPVGLVSGSTAYDADGVDVAVRMLRNSPLPRYPDILRQSGVAGRVRVRFVVGTDGRAELGTVEILEHSHAAFADAVRHVIPRLRFTPARVGTRSVRQVVEIPFGFELK